MPMYQNSVLKNVTQDESTVALRWAEYHKYADKIDFIKSVKEEKYQEGFLKDIFENDKALTCKLKTEITKTDKEIDKMVYELYGLSDEEIKIVEGVDE